MSKGTDPATILKTTPALHRLLAFYAKDVDAKCKRHGLSEGQPMRVELTKVKPRTWNIEVTHFFAYEKGVMEKLAAAFDGSKPERQGQTVAFSVCFSNFSEDTIIAGDQSCPPVREGFMN